jgi:hypothetical protein
MPDPNNIILRDLELAFILPCKSANTSVKLALCKRLGIEVPEPENPPQYGVHNADLFEYVAAADIPERYKVIGVMRDPLARILSMYQFTAPKQMAFGAWIRRQAIRSDRDVDQHERSQLYEFLVDGELRVNAMLYVEYLQDDWQALETLMGWEGPGGISHANRLEESGIERLPVRAIPELSEPRTSETWRSLYARYGADFFAYDTLGVLRTSNIITVTDAIHDTVALAAMPTTGSVS